MKARPRSESSSFVPRLFARLASPVRKAANSLYARSSSAPSVVVRRGEPINARRTRSEPYEELHRMIRDRFQRPAHPQPALEFQAFDRSRDCHGPNQPPFVPPGFDGARRSHRATARSPSQRDGSSRIWKFQDLSSRGGVTPPKSGQAGSGCGRLAPRRLDRMECHLAGIPAVTLSANLVFHQDFTRLRS